MIAQTPEPPYYAVIFTTIRTNNKDGYEQTAKRMMELASQQFGFLGVESAHGDLGITVSYWKDKKSIQNWKENYEHSIAQRKGKSKWYQSFTTRIAKVERDNNFQK